MIFSHLLLKNESGLTIDSLQKKIATLQTIYSPICPAQLQPSKNLSLLSRFTVDNFRKKPKFL